MGHDDCRDEAQPCPLCNSVAKDPGLTPSPGLLRSLPDGFNVEATRNVDEPE
jgi:hypothetical protein